jgi:pimeloyl-ACP methyl ester carboxylesterase
MPIELVHASASRPSKPVKLLFVHGICAAAWVWEMHFLPHFARLGYESYALSLRGHGASHGGEKIRSYGLGDFAADIEWALDRIGAPTVVIGHSLGGAVVQNFFKRGGRSAGAVLFCSVPPHGLMRAAAVMMTQNPQLANQLRKAFLRGSSAANLEIVERSLFSHAPSPEIRNLLLRHMNSVAEEASRQVMGWSPFAPLPWSMPKLLVLGCERDQVVPPADVRLTAIYYGTRSVIVKGGAHAIILDKNWEDAAAPLSDWLARSFDPLR